jgi:hypothetical protein
MKEPTEVLEAWLRYQDYNRTFQWGRIAMALETLTVVRSLDLYGVAMGDFEREQIKSVLETFLNGQGLLDKANEVYDFLLDWRKLKFVPIEDADE